MYKLLNKDTGILKFPVAESNDRLHQMFLQTVDLESDSKFFNFLIKTPCLKHSLTLLVLKSCIKHGVLIKILEFGVGVVKGVQVRSYQMVQYNACIMIVR